MNKETLEETYNKWSLEEAQKFALSKFKYGNHSKKGYITIELILELILEVLKVGVLTGHKFGAKWQAERMYSEEEVLELLNKREDYINSEDNIFEYQSNKEWFKQFKKK
jgi:hypothetical protein